MWDVLITLGSVGIAIYFLFVEPLLKRKKVSLDVTTPMVTDDEIVVSSSRRDGDDGFSALESQQNGLDEISEKEKNDEKFYERLLIIAAGIGAGVGKTKILKALPGYSGDLHPRLSNMYEGVKESLEKSGHWAKLRSKG